MLIITTMRFRSVGDLPLPQYMACVALLGRQSLCRLQITEDSRCEYYYDNLLYGKCVYFLYLY